MPDLNQNITLVECPRDAIQGLHGQISTEKKVAYINFLIRTGLFECIDFGSFVSPVAVPQMADTEAVVRQLDLINDTRLLAIVVNEKGVERATAFEQIHYLGYPFSISEEFQRRNTNANLQQSFERLKYIVERTKAGGKEPVVYISMAFGNPYKEIWSEQLVIDWLGNIAELGVTRFSLADTTGEASVEQIDSLFHKVYELFTELHIGAHFHSTKLNSMAKIKAAFDSGCKTFDGAMLGYGGCPFAKDDLVGNIAMEDLLLFFGRGNAPQIEELKQQFNTLIS
ncbi:hydroxymethylglutaryl-CoA lyase [Sphingobacterium spiritivorum]|uniref:HMGL-like protein n=1 Tax=Sphingobacterium spiritivorum ATCC 33861 TaxID=525373 RepID=D7VRM2_SPHSI|nr:hydroxymethylglutaryl-CoA lyase [Sphingobacterium spiritivorum]EFK56423.1 HMGL-like protein [Sphingobacterium spiritivorum ATCC 33861]QQT35504.1 hydroxymethylglutaryl-CoA lyase [Sphingobacterium spiritivorum]WQD32195.1 hydroxymethylglutaryl-CoA lyase [Sphingobacterium spiritivorum]SUJ06593.1 Hydroxymethylglutaryl-CoA lyase yngG [Sphingobacterium spiritivorum]